MTADPRAINPSKADAARMRGGDNARRTHLHETPDIDWDQAIQSLKKLLTRLDRADRRHRARQKRWTTA